jgi:CRISPR-associated protein Cmr4
MFAAAEGMFMYLESSLRVGSGEDRREVDLPIQREAATGYPFLPGSTLKGVLRARARSLEVPAERLGLLGSGPEADDRQPSSVVVSDALPLLFPVRSLTGLFAWVTSLDVWARFRRDLAAYGVTVAEPPGLVALAPETAGVAPESPLVGSKQALVLEELSFPVQVADEVGALGAWLAEHTFPDVPAFDFWRQRAARAVVLLPEGAYRYFVTHATQVVPRIRIDPKTATAAPGSLWTEEYLPPETLVYALVGANLPETPPPGVKKARDVTDWVRGLAPGHLQMGGGQTLGHGIVHVRWTGKATTRARRAAPTRKR